MTTSRPNRRSGPCSTAPRRARHATASAAAAYDFSRCGTIVDIGGGNGALMIEILRAHQGPRGIVFDLPAVTERARQNIAAAGLADRCTAVHGNALETVPEGADAYILSNFLIGMADEQAAGILRRCSTEVADGGRVLLFEWVMPAGGEMPEAFKFWDTASRDVIMLSIYGAPGGRVRTAEEFQALLEAGGLRLAEIIPTASSVSVIEALPVNMRAN